METKDYFQALRNLHQVSVGLEAYLRFVLLTSHFIKNQRIFLKLSEFNRFTFISDGLVRIFTHDLTEEKEITLSFLAKGEYLSIDEHLALPDYSEIELEFLENTSMISIPITHFKNLYSLYPEFHSIDSKIHIQSLIKQFSHQALLCKSGALERYNVFLKKYPRVVQLCEVKKIASFLAMNAKTLSRIRALRPQ